MPNDTQLHIRLHKISEGHYYGVVLEYPVIEAYAESEALVRSKIKAATKAYFQKLKNYYVMPEYSVEELDICW